jgi:hypothetical protein
MGDSSNLFKNFLSYSFLLLLPMKYNKINGGIFSLIFKKYLFKTNQNLVFIFLFFDIFSIKIILSTPTNILLLDKNNYINKISKYTIFSEHRL